MKLAAVAFCLCLIAGAVWLGLTLTTSTESGETVESCVAEPIEEADASFCSNLEVTYVEVGNVTCKIIPQCNHFRQKITAWPPPQVKFREAESDKSYVLVMVDPDAPSRNEPTMKYWRHWVVSDIIGANIKNGLPRGNVLTAYEPPTPPPTTGLHRYQFRLYRQGDKQVSISSNENKNRGAWNLDKFLADHNLSILEASTQYMTEFDGEIPNFNKVQRDDGDDTEDN